VAYTLYADGSIEAVLPSEQYAASIDALRFHRTK
jgi:hypothetical protein